MNRAEVLELIANRENSRVEFKRDDIHPDQLTKEMSALLNLEGGVILLGVEKEGQVSGLTRSREEAEEWVMNIARNNLQPPTTPVWTSVLMENGSTVGIVELPPDSPGKPHKAKRGKAWVTFTRVGSESQEATREEEGRLYQAAGLVRYEIKAVPDMGLESLEMERIESYLRHVLKRPAPNPSDQASWRRLLLNTDLLVAATNRDYASVAGLLLFGKNPNRRLPQAGVTAAAFPGAEKDYNTVDEERIRGPLTPIVSNRGDTVERGVIDRTVDFVKRNMGSVAWLEGGRRRREGAFPLDAVREAVVNALVHRDYAHEGTDVEVSLYANRLEIISPGRLPNGVTVEKMREGVVRVARNELLKEILRDYRYIEHQGMGVRNRIIESMRQHNGTEPDLEETEDRFLVRLWKAQPTSNGADQAP
ncbi:MAG: ATP-dependent DNA helicase RecG [Gammaproteobacteria bacterium]|nr:ATP-dependent DNA helicase RecG [Gammaproteobacteria bacterium]MYE53195.1 ATP-dependent DNA helicase RecG [Gammaproteobacteria bacterium]MYF51105.1 ATP-dependent DNA helicase RecG [Gammaproteobacteria bacterium]